MPTNPLFDIWSNRPPKTLPLKPLRRNSSQEQAPRLYAAIRRSGRKGPSYLELNLLGISTSSWKRLSESTNGLREGERLERGERDWRVVFKVVRG